MTPFGYPVLPFLVGEVRVAQAKQSRARWQSDFNLAEFTAAELEFLARICHLFNFIEQGIK
jgi:hypothetical protein